MNRRYILGGDSADAHGAHRLDFAADAQAALRKLTSEFQISVATGAFNEAFLLDRKLEATLAAEPTVLLQATGMLSDERLEELAQRVDMTPLMHALFDVGMPGEGVLAYRAAPLIFAHSLGFGPDDTLSQSLDIVANARRVVTLGPEGPVLSPLAALKAGVWESHAETLALTTETSVDPLSTTNLFAKATGTPLVVTDAEDPALDALNLSARAKTNIERDLDQGFAVVLPTGLPEGQHSTGWWRVNPQTGETLGMLENGSGGVTLQYAELISQISAKLTVVLSGFVIGTGVGTGVGIFVYQGCVASVALYSYTLGYKNSVYDANPSVETVKDAISKKWNGCVGLGLTAGGSVGAAIGGGIVGILATAMGVIIATVDVFQLDEADKCPRGYTCVKN